LEGRIKARRVTVSMTQQHYRYPEHKELLLKDGHFFYDGATHGPIVGHILFFGPYIPLPPGHYSISFIGEIEGTIQLRLSKDCGFMLKETEISGINPSVTLKVGKSIENFEVVGIRTPSLKRATIKTIIIDPLSEQNAARLAQIEAKRFEDGLRRDLQDRAEAIDAGRNIVAGYRRGIGLALGGLIPTIKKDPDWIAAMAASRGRSIVSQYNLMNLFLIIKYSNITGNIIEFGSYHGGSALFMAALAKRLRPGCKVFALDTFEGMPRTDNHLDWHSSGGFTDGKIGELEQIKEEEGLDNLIILKGLFQDTCPMISAEDARFFLSHVDCDIYESARYAIDFSKEHAVPGSYIVFDDALVADCLGLMKAVEQDLVQQGIHAEQVSPHLVYRYPPVSL
jgi:hypothetical protein